MARVEDTIRRFSVTNNSALNAVYMDNFIDVSELQSSNVLYDFALTPSTTQEETPSSPNVSLPSTVDGTRTIQKYSKDNDKLSSTERIYFCNECGSSFSNSSNLKSHLRIHTGEKPFSCEFCGLAFVQSSNLKAHKRIHTGEKPYKCLDCGKSFSRSSHLVGHRRTHTGECPYSCGVCSKSFASSTQLRLHTQKHGETDLHVCSVCAKTFDKSSALALHLQIHTGDRPYVCQECTAAFRSKDDLNIHRKLHSGEVYQYTCRRCGKGFKIKLCCEKHVKKCKNSKLKNSNFTKKYTSSPKTKYFSSFFDASFCPETSFTKRYLKKKQSQVFQFDDSSGVNGLCKMEMLEGSIEDGIENEVDEQMMVFTSEGGTSVLQVIPANGEKNGYITDFVNI